MKTTLELYCEFKGWQGATIHQCKADFKTLTMQDKDRICGVFANNSSNMESIESLNQMRWFMNARLGHLS